MHELKRVLLILIVFISLPAFAQQISGTGPVYGPCSQAEDPELCLYEALQQALIRQLDTKSITRLRMRFQSDSLMLRAAFLVLDDGNITQQEPIVPNADPATAAAAERALLELEKFQPARDINDQAISFLVTMPVYFQVSGDWDAPELRPLPREGNYGQIPMESGLLEEPPVFPGCIATGAQETIRCFNIRMQEHMAANFRYPKKAVRKRISGRVYIFFLIDKEGKVSQIRTEGADPILQDEARRIIRLLPQMTPGYHKGKPVRVPFVIPLTFRL